MSHIVLPGPTLGHGLPYLLAGAADDLDPFTEPS